MEFQMNMEMLKEKILCTDNLINMYDQTKARLEESQKQVRTLEHKCKQKEADNRLIQTQLKAMLADKNPSELQMQRQHIAKLEKTIETLNDQIKSSDMARLMLEDKIHSMKEHDTEKKDCKKKHVREIDKLTKQISKLQKTTLSLEKEIMQLHKKNEVLQERLRRKRYRGSGSFSQATDSELNMSVHSEDASRTESEERTSHNETSFKSPLPDKKKKLKKKHRNSLLTDGSENEEEIPKKNPTEEEMLRFSTVNEGHSKESQMSANGDEMDFKSSVAKENVDTFESDQNDTGTLATSCDEMPSTTSTVVVTSTMKARMLEMKTKKALRSFTRRPSGTQHTEILALVKRLKQEAAAAQTEVENFCKTHFLVGHEVRIAKKIVNMHQDSLGSDAVDMLWKVKNNSLSDISQAAKSMKTNIALKETTSVLPHHTNAPSNFEKSSQKVVSETTHQCDTATRSVSDQHKSISDLPQILNSSDSVTVKVQQNDCSVTKGNSNLSLTNMTSILTEETTALKSISSCSQDEMSIDNGFSQPLLVGDNDSTGNLPKEDITMESFESVSGIFSSDDDHDITVNIQAVSDIPPQSMDPAKSTILKNSQSKMQTKCAKEESVQNFDVTTPEFMSNTSSKPQTNKIRTRSVSRSMSESSDTQNYSQGILPNSINNTGRIRTRSTSKSTSVTSNHVIEGATLPTSKTANFKQKSNTRSSVKAKLKNSDSLNTDVVSNIETPSKIINHTENQPCSNANNIESTASLPAGQLLAETASKASNCTNTPQLHDEEYKLIPKQTCTESSDKLPSSKKFDDVSNKISSDDVSSTQLVNDSLKSFSVKEMPVRQVETSAQPVAESAVLNIPVTLSHTDENPISNHIEAKEELAKKERNENDKTRKVGKNLKRKSASLQEMTTSKRRRSSAIKVSSNAVEKVISVTTRKKEVKKRTSSTDVKKTEDLFSKITHKFDTSNSNVSKDCKGTRHKLTSMVSLPFTVGHESPVVLNSTQHDNGFNFLSSFQEASKDLNDDVDDDMDSVGSLKNDLFASSLSDVEAIFVDMAVNSVVSLPLTPVKFADNNTVIQDDLKAVQAISEVVEDDDARTSIFPSADLCTAFRFSSDSCTEPKSDKKIEVKSKKEEASNVKHKKRKVFASKSDTSLPSDEQKESHASNLRDTPRRFSCEAPVRARPVPSIKPAVRADSLDPSLTENNSELDTDTTCTPGSTSSKTAASGNALKTFNVLTHTFSGPFKVVAPGTTHCKVDNPSAEVVAPRTGEIMVESLSKHETNLLEPNQTEPISPASNESNVATESGDNDNEMLTSDDIDDIVSSFSCEHPISSFSPDITRNSDLPVEVESTNEDVPAVPKQPLRATGENPQPKKVKRQYLRTVDTEKDRSILVDTLKQIQSVAAKRLGKSHVTVSAKLVIQWFLDILPYTANHSVRSAVSEYITKFENPSRIHISDILHEWEYKVVMMIVAVDRVRRRTYPCLIDTVVLPTLLRTLCSYGQTLPKFKPTFNRRDFLSILPSYLCDASYRHSAQRNHLTKGETLSLVSMFAFLCRSIGNARALMELCRYCLLANPFKETLDILYHCVVCYPNAFRRFPLTGKLIILYTMFQVVYASTKMDGSEKYNIPNNDHSMVIRGQVVAQLEKCVGWHGTVDSCNPTGTENWDEKWQLIYLECMTRIEKAQLVDEISNLGEISVSNINMEGLDDAFRAIEFISSWKGMVFVSNEIIKGKFWPWLNMWSRQLVDQTSSTSNKTAVSDACVIAVFRALTNILLAMLTRQKMQDVDQPLPELAVSSFETTCALLIHFTGQLKEKAPLSVQCAAAITVFQLAFCKPENAYKVLHDWLIAHKNDIGNAPEVVIKKKKASNKPLHRLLPQLIVFFPCKNLRQLVAWLDGQTTSMRFNFEMISLTKLLWGA